MNYSLRALLYRPLSNFTGASLVLAFVVRIVVAVGGATFLIIGAHSLYYGDMSNWHEVKATVIGSESESSDPVIYTPDLSYEVNGKTYTGAGTQATTQQYTVGKQITISVNPKDPTDIYQRDARGESKNLIAFGLLVLMLPILWIGISAIIQLVKIKRRR